MKKKVAIFLRGGVSKIQGKLGTVQQENQYVNFECTRRSIQKHIIDANPEYEFDFFFHSWNIDLKEKLLDLYSPKSFLFENNADFKTEIESKLWNGGSFAQVSQFLSYKKACELIAAYSAKTSTQYDVIIGYRPDVMLWKNINLANYDLSKVTVNSWLDCLGDFHIIFSPTYINRMIGVYDRIGEIVPEPHHIIVKCFSDVIVMDGILAGEHQEITRKLYKAVLDNKFNKDNLNDYGITLEEIERYGE